MDPMDVLSWSRSEPPSQGKFIQLQVPEIQSALAQLLSSPELETYLNLRVTQPSLTLPMLASHATCIPSLSGKEAGRPAAGAQAPVTEAGSRQFEPPEGHNYKSSSNSSYASTLHCPPPLVLLETLTKRPRTQLQPTSSPPYHPAGEPASLARLLDTTLLASSTPSNMPCESHALHSSIPVSGYKRGHYPSSAIRSDSVRQIRDTAPARTAAGGLALLDDYLLRALLNPGASVAPTPAPPPPAAAAAPHSAAPSTISTPATPASFISRWPVRCLAEPATEPGLSESRTVPCNGQSEERRRQTTATYAGDGGAWGRHNGCGTGVGSRSSGAGAAGLQRQGSPTLDEALLLLSAAQQVGLPTWCDPIRRRVRDDAGSRITGVDESMAGVAVNGGPAVSNIDEHADNVAGRLVPPLSLAQCFHNAVLRATVPDCARPPAPPLAAPEPLAAMAETAASAASAAADVPGSDPAADAADIGIAATAATEAAQTPVVSDSAAPAATGAAVAADVAGAAAALGVATGASAVAGGSAVAATAANSAAAAVDTVAAVSAGGAAAAAVGPYADDAVSADHAAGESAEKHEVQQGATGNEFPAPASVPVPVIVCVPLAPGASGGVGSGEMPTPATVGVFDPARYLRRVDCIRLLGQSLPKWVSRSRFEKLCGSNTAKWYRSIRVLRQARPHEIAEGDASHGDGSAAPAANPTTPLAQPHATGASKPAAQQPLEISDRNGTAGYGHLEALGGWLARHNLPVFKGPNRLPTAPKPRKRAREPGQARHGGHGRTAPRTGLGAAAAAAAAAMMAADEAARAPAGSHMCASAAASAMAAAAAAAAAVRAAAEAAAARAAAVAAAAQACEGNGCADGPAEAATEPVATATAPEVLAEYGSGDVSALEAALRARGLTPPPPQQPVPTHAAAACSEPGPVASARHHSSGQGGRPGGVASGDTPAGHEAEQEAAPQTASLSGLCSSSSSSSQREGGVSNGGGAGGGDGCDVAGAAAHAAQASPRKRPAEEEALPPADSPPPAEADAEPTSAVEPVACRLAVYPKRRRYIAAAAVPLEPAAVGPAAPTTRREGSANTDQQARSAGAAPGAAPVRDYGREWSEDLEWQRHPLSALASQQQQQPSARVPPPYDRHPGGTATWRHPASGMAARSGPLSGAVRHISASQAPAAGLQRHPPPRMVPYTIVGSLPQPPPPHPRHLQRAPLLEDPAGTGSRSRPPAPPHGFHAARRSPSSPDQQWEAPEATWQHVAPKPPHALPRRRQSTAAEVAPPAPSTSEGSRPLPPSPQPRPQPQPSLQPPVPAVDRRSPDASSSPWTSSASPSVADPCIGHEFSDGDNDAEGFVGVGTDAHMPYDTEAAAAPSPPRPGGPVRRHDGFRRVYVSYHPYNPWHGKAAAPQRPSAHIPPPPPAPTPHHSHKPPPQLVLRSLPPEAFVRVLPPAAARSKRPHGAMQPAPPVILTTGPAAGPAVITSGVASGGSGGGDGLQPGPARVYVGLHPARSVAGVWARAPPAQRDVVHPYGAAARPVVLRVRPVLVAYQES